jgi:RNA-directed DNA polymerase
LPLGNVTSQIFANIYLNELDWFIKRKLRTKNYFRYADDFIIAHPDKEYLLHSLKEIKNFLGNELNLQLHPKKVSIRKFHQGIDFLGYVILPHHKVLRTKTKKRMYRKLKEKHAQLKNGIISKEKFDQSLQSYLGILKHCEGYKIRQNILKKIKN